MKPAQDVTGWVSSCFESLRRSQQKTLAAILPAVRPENSVRGLRGDGRVSAGVISGNQMTYSGATASVVAGKCLADKRRKCL